MTVDALANARCAGAALADRLDRPLVLVGLMGAGKSTVGQRVARLLGRDFVDSDAEIERAGGMSVADLFQRWGEPAFRDGERRVIRRLLEERHGVIATGGGAFVDPRTRQAILDGGIVVWLDCDLDTLATRTKRRDTRPLLRGGDHRAILGRLLAERKPSYEQAHLRVETGNRSLDQTAQSVLAALDAWL